MTPHEAQQMVDLMSAEPPQDFTSKILASLAHDRHPLNQCGYEVACYGDERLICGEPVIEGTPRCRQHQGLDIKPWEARRDR